MDKIIVDYELLHQAMICLESDGHGGATERCESCRVVEQLHKILDEQQVTH